MSTDISHPPLLLHLHFENKWRRNEARIYRWPSTIAPDCKTLADFVMAKITENGMGKTATLRVGAGPVFQNGGRRFYLLDQLALDIALGEDRSNLDVSITLDGDEKDTTSTCSMQ